MKDTLISIVNSTPPTHTIQKIRKTEGLKDWITSHTEFLPKNAELSERTWNIINNHIDIKVCKYGNIIPFNTLVLGYRQFCAKSNKCQCKIEVDREYNRNFQLSLSKEEREEVEAKKVATYNERYGCDRPLQNKSIKEKQKETTKKRYGNEDYFASDDFKGKSKETCLGKYGVEYAVQSESIKKKRSDTSLIKYGTSNPSQAEEVKKKRSNTFKSKFGKEVNCPSKIPGIYELSKVTSNIKYGCDNPSQNKTIKNKKIETSLNNYGVSNPAQSQIIKDKSISTNLQKYNRDNPSQRHIPLEVYDLLNNKFWLENEGKTLSATEVSKILCVNVKVVNRYKKIHNIWMKEKSQVERIISSFLTELNKDHKRNDRITLDSKKELDFLIPSHNLAIEYCGLYWHSEVYKDSQYHKNKLLECQEKGIRLITIFEDEWLKHRKSCEEYIKNILHINTQAKIFARKCIVEEVSFSEVRNILNDNHIQGAPPFAKKSLVLKYEGKIVSVMCFSHQRGKMDQTNLWDLTRFCNNNCKVVGAASKLFSYFIKNYNPDKVISFADARWSQGDVYYKIGFKMEQFINPDYWYIKNGERYHKSGFSKNKLQSKGIDITGKSEREIMKEQKFLRIYDCGKYRFVWDRDPS